MNRKKVKERLLYIFTAIGATSFLFFGVVNFFTEQKSLGVLEIIFGFAALANIIYLHFTENTELASYVMLSLLYVALMLILYSGGLGGTGYLWVFTFPPLCFYLLEKKEALSIWIFYLFSILAIYLLQSTGVIETPTSNIVFRQLLASNLAVSLIIYAFVANNDSFEKELEESFLQLQKAQADLKEEAQKNLSVKSSLSEKQVEEEKSKKAMINLLEDLNLEKQETEKQAQELLKFKLAVEHASDHIIITNNEGKVIYANPAAERTTGYTQEEIIGQTPRLWGQQMSKEFYEKMWHTIKNDKKSFDGEITNKRKSGELYVAVSHISPIMDSKGNVIFFVGIERDVTAERQIEKLKDEFISIASHELRTPMTAIKGFVSMILDGDYGDIPTKAKEPLQDISTSTERLIKLVNDMLNISRIEAGRMKYEITEFDAKPLVEQTVSNLQPVAKDKGISLLAKVDSVKVVFDQNKLTQVLNNLIGNALKFTQKGRVEITSEIKEDKLNIYVADTGIGMSSEAQKTLFTKFGQVNDTSKNDVQGTGLGLYISKNMAQKLGGDVWIVKSMPSKGTVFGIAIPLVGSEAAKDAAKIIEREAKENPDQKEMS